MEGHSLADGLNEFPGSFPEIYRATVAAAEQSGHLDSVLERLADYTESRQELRQRTTGALLYPVMLFFVCIAIVVFLLATVVPKITAVFENREASLPLLTVALIGASHFLRAYGIYLLVSHRCGAVWLYALVARRGQPRALASVPAAVARDRQGRPRQQRGTLRAHAQYADRQHGAVLEALRISGEVVTNLPMRNAVADAAVRVREGAPIGRSLGQSRLFPPMLIHLISSGESSGELDEMLERAATHQERELDAILQGVVGLLGPLMILVMGGLVLLIVLAMLMPIFQLNELVK
jgi:general secretion pathway protein F